MSTPAAVRLTDDLDWCPRCRGERLIEVRDATDPAAEPVAVCVDCGSPIDARTG